MPQLDFSTFPSQAFWLVVSFALMWLVMAKMIVPKITDILNQRQRKIDDYLTAAGEFKQTAEEALEKYERVLREANAERRRRDENVKGEEERGSCFSIFYSSSISFSDRLVLCMIMATGIPAFFKLRATSL